MTAYFICLFSTFMFDEDHFNSQASSGGIYTQQNPKKGRVGTLADGACSADLCLLCAISIRFQGGDETVFSSVFRLVERLRANVKKPPTVFCERG